MKGLILKDLYMTMKYFRIYLLIIVAFIALSLMDTDNLFFAFYPCILCSVIPTNLLGYDERSKWLQYSQALPYTKAQFVSAKYIIGLGAQMITLLITCMTRAIFMSINNIFILKEYLVIIMLLLVMSLLASSISLPFIFKMGVEKGRMAYYIMLGCVCAGTLISSKLLRSEMTTRIQPNGILALICLVGILIYALSWYLSIVFYKKREL